MSTKHSEHSVPSACNGWSPVMDEQRQRDREIRLEQAQARRLVDNALRETGRLWISECRLHHREQQVMLPVPPQFEELVGYTGAARYIALYRGTGEECYLNDGRSVSIGEADVFAAYTRHWFIVLTLCGAYFGSSDDSATHCLLLDRNRGQMTLALIGDAMHLIQCQWSEPEPELVRVVELGEWALLVKEAEEHMRQLHPNLLAWEIEHQKQVQEMITWLDEWGQLYGK